MEEFVHIAALETVTEAQLLETVLQERKIPHAIRLSQDAGHGDLSADSEWGCIDAPVIYQKMIMYIISDLRKDASRHGDRPSGAAS